MECDRKGNVLSETATPAPGQAEGNQGTEGSVAPGSPADASPGGSATEGTPSAEPGSWEARAKGWQSQSDQRQARITELERQLASAQTSTTETTQTDAGAQPMTQEAFLATMDAREAMRDMRAAVEREFGEGLHPDILRNYAQYESPEALYQAAKGYADWLTGLREGIREEEAAKLRGETSGGKDLPPVTTQTAGGGGQPTAEQIASMSQSDFEALDPAYVNSILAKG